MSGFTHQECPRTAAVCAAVPRPGLGNVPRQVHGGRAQPPRQAGGGVAQQGPGPWPGA